MEKAIIEACLRMQREGLIIGTSGNVSVRTGKEVLITPSGVEYTRLSAADLVRLNLQGEIIQGHLSPSSEFWLHLKIYAARPEIKAIIHTHSKFSTAFALAGRNIPAELEEFYHVLGQQPIKVAAYGANGSLELANNAVAALGKGKAVLLARHGLVGISSQGLEEAFLICQTVERAAEIHWLAQALS